MVTNVCGGAGGFASAEYIAQIGEQLEICVGKGGQMCNTDNASVVGGAGGPNGGNGRGNYNAGGGGGSSHIISQAICAF